MNSYSFSVLVGWVGGARRVCTNVRNLRGRCRALRWLFRVRAASAKLLARVCALGALCGVFCSCCLLSVSVYT